VHQRFSDAELAEYLTEVDVVVLPYVFGTHSGWVEACHDAGTTVVAPDCGFFTEQHGAHEYGYGLDGLDAASLERAVTAALADLARPGHDDLARRERRLLERTEVGNAMVDLYRSAVVSASAA